MVVRKALLNFFKTALGPDDLVGYMTPHMSGRDISFSSSTEPARRAISTTTRSGASPTRSPGTETDPIERDLSTCFIGNDAAWGPLRSRLREQKSIESLRGLVAHLDGLRESRKAVIAVTQGWRLFRENETRLTDARTTGNRIMRPRPGRRRPGRRLGTDDRSTLRRRRPRGPATAPASKARWPTASSLFRDLIGEANRASTSFYTARRGRPAHRDAAASRRRAARCGRSRRATGSACRTRRARLDPHARRVDQRDGHRRQQRLQRSACARPPPTSTPTTCSATRRRTARPTASTARSK